MDWAKGGPCIQHLSLSIRAAPPSPEALLFPSGLGGDGRGRPRLPQAPAPRIGAPARNLGGVPCLPQDLPGDHLGVARAPACHAHSALQSVRAGNG